jgi:hypothetical protein
MRRKLFPCSLAAGTQVTEHSFLQGGAVMDLPIQLIDFAVANAASRTTREDVTAGLVAALRCVRSVVSQREGFASLCALDDGIRERLLMERLRQRDGGAAESQFPPLPQASWSRTRQIATAILTDVVALILTANGPVPFGLIAGGMVHYLLSHLIGCLGGPPDADELLTAVRGAEESLAAGIGPEPPTVIRVH